MAFRSGISETREFGSVTVILPVIAETVSLEKTVAVILDESPEWLREIILVVCERTSQASLAVIAELVRRHPDMMVVHRQTLPFLGGAIRDAFTLARGSHVLMMASDLETDPADVKVLIEAARRRPDAVITASRWRAAGGFHGYGRLKLAANWAFQRLFALIYATDLTDLTFGYRLFPTALVQAIAWQELRHAFLFETLVKPLRLGVPVIEVPSRWTARTEGRSSNSFARNVCYLRTGLAVRFADRASLLRLAPENVESLPE
jgi:hypothetical protein